jgi:ABC-type Zn uptake system ZnuABC Zn-binding protein ZnuA
MVNRFLSAWIIVFLVMSWVLAACGPSPSIETQPPAQATLEKMPELEPVALGAGEKLRVVATTNIVGDVIARVGGEQISLTILIPPGADPHTFQPTPKDASAVAQAHIVIMNGAGLEGWMQEFLANAGGTRPLVSASAGLTLRKGEHEHGLLDPHVWFDVKNVITWVHNIEEALSALDPANADTYHKNAAMYRAELQELDNWIVAQVKKVPPERRKLVTNHEVFGYFCERYGFQQVGTIFPITTEARPSAKDLAALQEKIKAAGAQTIFTETTVSSETAEQLARDTGVKVVRLYTDSLGPAGSEADSYIRLMRYDVEAIINALR